MSKKRNKQDKPQGTETENDNTLEGTEGQLTEGTEGSEGEAPARGETSTTEQLDESGFVKQDDGSESKEPEQSEDKADDGSKEDDQLSEDDKSSDGDIDQAPSETEQNQEGDDQSDDEKQAAEETKRSPLDGDYKHEAANIINNRINDYAEAMHPSQTQTPESIRFQQRELLSIFDTVLRQDEAFEESMKAIVTTVRENRKGAFREHSVFRGMNRLGLGSNRVGRFDQLINLFLAAADSKNPKEVSKVVDLKTFYTKYLQDDGAQSRLASYFGS